MALADVHPRALGVMAPPRTLHLSLGVSAGVAVALAVALPGGRGSAAAQWLAELPGRLFSDALQAATLPVVFLHAVLLGAQVASSASAASISRWRRCGVLAACAFASATLFASALGVVLAVGLGGLVQPSTALTSVWSASPGALVTFGCSGSADNTSLALQSGGAFVCATTEQANASSFVVDDVARSFVLTRDADGRGPLLSVLDQTVAGMERALPMSVASALLQGDVLGLLLLGLVLGVALACFDVYDQQNQQPTQASERSLEDVAERQNLLLTLAAQGEGVLCHVLRALQRWLPLGVALMTSSTLLRSGPEQSTESDAEAATVLTFAALVLLALVLDVAVMLILAGLLTRSNPFEFLRELVPAQLVALSSGSTLVALPATASAVASTQRVSSQLAFVLSAAGAVLNQTGGAIYLSVGSLFLLSASASDSSSAQLAAAHSPATLVALVFANALCASALSPLPAGGKTAAMATALGAVLGVETAPRAALLTALAAFEWLSDPLVACVTATNNALVALVVAHLSGDAQFATEDTESSGALMREAPLDSHQGQERQSLMLNSSRIAL